MDLHQDPIGLREFDLKGREELAPSIEISNKYSIQFLKQFIESNKKKGTYIPVEDPDNFLPLNKSQQEVINIVDNFLRLPTAQAKKQPLRFLLTGVAGGGKSLVIKRIRKLFEDRGRRIFLCSPYGSVASQLSAVTCHNLFGVPYKGGSFEKLASRLKKSKSLARKFYGLDCIVIDEVYNLSPSFLNYISQVLCISIGNPAPFAGISIILSGDLLQLSPVASHALWTDLEKLNTFQKQGALLYRNFTTVYFLNESMRSVDTEFAELLLHMRQKRLTVGDLENLRARREKMLSPEERSLFCDSPRIYPRNVFSREYNRLRIQQLNKPVILLTPVQEPAFPSIIQESEVVPITIGARVRLQKNLDVLGGLATSATGVVEGVLYDKPEDPLPAIVFVRFHNIRTATLEGGLTPIPSSKEYVTDPVTSKSFQITSFPLNLDWAFSVHVSQGSSMERVMIYLDYRELYLNSTYVCLSRIKGGGLSKICILDEEIPESRFESQHFYSGFKEIKAEYKRLGIDKYLLSSESYEKAPTPKRVKMDIKINEKNQTRRQPLGTHE